MFNDIANASIVREVAILVNLSDSDTAAIAFSRSVHSREILRVPRSKFLARRGDDDVQLVVFDDDLGLRCLAFGVAHFFNRGNLVALASTAFEDLTSSRAGGIAERLFVGKLDAVSLDVDFLVFKASSDDILFAIFSTVLLGREAVLGLVATLAEAGTCGFDELSVGSNALASGLTAIKSLDC